MPEVSIIDLKSQIVQLRKENVRLSQILLQYQSADIARMEEELNNEKSSAAQTQEN